MKRKTARAIEANVGVRRRLEKKLQSFQKAVSGEVADLILLHIAESGQLAEDWSLTRPTTPKDRKSLREISSKVLAAWKRNPDAFRRNVEGYVDAHLGEWVVDISTRARKIAVWLARSLAAEVTSSQRRAYIAAGISPDFLREKWTVPVVRQHISRSAADILPNLVEWSTELITRMATKDVERVQNVIVSGLANGQSVRQVRTVLSSMRGFDKNRAANVALDQTNKITNGIAQANDREMGVTEGIWIHVPGQYSSRASHKRLNGKRFDLSKGVWDEEVGKWIHCAELPYCRCIYRPVLPWEKLGLKT